MRVDFSKIVLVGLLGGMCVGLCLMGISNYTGPGYSFNGTYTVKGEGSEVQSALFEKTSVTFTYRNETTQTFSWKLEKDKRYMYSSYKILTIGDLVYSVTRITKNMYRIEPLFGETPYRSLYLIRK